MNAGGHASGTADSPLGRFLTDPSGTWETLSRAATALMTTWAPITVPVLVILTVLATTGRNRLRRRQREHWALGARCVTIQAPPKVEPASGAALWAQLSGLALPWWRRLLEGQPHLGFEYDWTAGGLTVRMWLPGPVPFTLIRQAIQAAWPGALTELEDAGSALTPGHLVTAGAMRLARPEVLPLQTKHDADPLRGLLQAASDLTGEQHALVQILARPATGARLRRARAAARNLKAGHGTGGRAAAVAGLLTHRQARGAAVKADPAHGAETRHSVTKLTGPQWAVSIRYAATDIAPDGDVPEKEHPATQDRLRGRVHALATAFSILAGQNWLVRTRLRNPSTTIAPRRFDGRGSLLSVPELAALAHVPLDADAPGLTRAGARSVVPPARIPAPGPGTDVKPLGVSDARRSRAVGVHVREGRQHLHVVGATGSGKSTLLANLILDDVHARRGVVVIDPKGDLVTDVLDRMPESAANRVVILDPDDPHTPPSLNILEGDDIDVVVDNVTGICRKIFSSAWGPRTDDIMRVACLTLMRYSRVTGKVVSLADVPSLLGDASYRARVVPTVKDPVIAGFWRGYAEMSDPARATVIAPLMNKLRAFLLRPFVRATVAGGPSTFELGSVLDGGICLVRVPKGALGEETMRLIGSFVVAKVWQGATRRSRQAEADRVDAALYIDEAHNFLTLPYGLEEMLAEARGYRLGMVLAHQHLAQLPDDLSQGISANARTKLYFQASPEDAKVLEQHTKPLLVAHDLANLGAYQVAARVLVEGAPAPAFTLTTTPLRPAIPGRADALRTAAHDRVGGKAPTGPHRP
ncbi:type IV secretory system conjugative DNA transfer family protein [Embleya sp. NPDC008237]|uniref:type IV secretory system conjugative DNA transfer family protein n=1 Tax=Embleya sp. NPDC008237 TaxID=3363978 RepID=UPI0036E8B8F4